jgi:putative flippase GtrA
MGILDHPQRRLLRFAALGCTNALIGCVVFVVLMHSGLFPDHARGAFSQAGSYGVGVIWAFFWSRHWAFRDRADNAGGLSTQAFRFALVQAWSLIVSVSLVSITIDGLGWQSLPSWAATMTIVTVVHYSAMSSWVFPLRADSHGDRVRIYEADRPS